MRRSLSLVVGIVFLLTGCGGGGGGTSSGSVVPGHSGAGTGTSSGGNVSFTLTIPTASTSSSVRRTRTISSSTQSITVVVNNGAPQIFNVSSSCSGTPLTCTLSVGAPYGLDTFLIETWSGANGGGNPLNAATLSMNVKTSGNPSPTVVAGTLVTVTSNADSGGTCGLTTNTIANCTLREAVSEAGTSGATTAIMFQGVSSITLASPISFQSKNISFIGPASGNLTINGGGNQIFNASGTVVISNMTLTGGNATACHDPNLSSSSSSSSGGCGGAVELDSGSLSLFSTTFNANSATQSGGAIYTGEKTSLSIFNGTFTGNKVNASASLGSGGAIYLLGDATIDSSSFTNNAVVAQASGEGDGGAITQSDFNTTGLTITNSQFLGNSTGSSSASAAFGGAVYEGALGPLAISGDTFGGSGNGNSAVAGNTNATSGGTAVGGAIFFFGSTLSDRGGGNTFASNSVNGTIVGVGGAIEVNAGSATFSGANTFSGNSATGGIEGLGGAIDLTTFPSFGVPTLTLGGSNSFTSNSVKTTASSDAGAFGGAIDFFSLTCGIITGPGTPATTPASMSGRGAASVFGPRGIAQGRIVAQLSRRFAAGSRHAAATTSGISSIAGTFTSNTAGPSTAFGASGGAINITSQSGAYTIANATLTGNSAVAGSGLSSGAGGGAISVFSGTVIVQNSQVANNQATTVGGGMYVTSFPAQMLGPGCQTIAGTMTIANTAISGNSVTGPNPVIFGGGGVGVNAAGLAIANSTIANNSVAGGSVGTGGGLLAVNFGFGFQTVTVLENSTVFNNTASGNGGGLANAAGSPSLVVLTNDTIYQNTATNGLGGSVFNDPVKGGGTANSATDIVQVQNSIIAGGSASANSDTNDAWNNDVIQSFDYNIVQTPSHTSPGNGACAPNLPTGSNGFCAHDQSNVNPQLASGLANNGGPTQTIADTSSSPGKGAIPFTSSSCNGAPFTSVDQRGYSRGAGGKCDVGAYEFAGTPGGTVSVPTPVPVPTAVATASVTIGIMSGARHP